MGVFETFGKWLAKTEEDVKAFVKRSTTQEYLGDWEHWLTMKKKSLIRTEVEVEGVTNIVESLSERSPSLKKRMAGLTLSLIGASSCSQARYSDSLKIMDGTPVALMYLTEDFHTGQQGCSLIRDAYGYVQNSLVTCSGSSDPLFRDAANLVGKTGKLIERFCIDANYRNHFNASKRCKPKGWACANKNRDVLIVGGMERALGGPWVPPGFKSDAMLQEYSGGPVGYAEGAMTAHHPGVPEVLPPGGGMAAPFPGSPENFAPIAISADHPGKPGGLSPGGGMAAPFPGGPEDFEDRRQPLHSNWKNRGKRENPATPEMDDVCRATTTFNSCTKKKKDCEKVDVNKKVEGELINTLDQFCEEHNSFKGVKQEVVGKKDGGAGGAATGNAGGKGKEERKSTDETSAAGLPLVKAALNYLPFAAFVLI